MTILAYDPDICAYLAGMFDGEGCVKVKAKVGSQGCSQANLTISNTDLRPLVLARDYFGGSIYLPKTRKCASWTVSGKEADAFAEAIKPFVLVKYEQLELFIAFRATMGGRGIFRTQEILGERENIEAQVLELRRAAYQ